ncbi:MAG: hypothetical protein IT342_11065 [Candidatus Melainabacteria bacterium]|nr:hypothetical protein [Candidatus Melainabacteria bacterium]
MSELNFSADAETLRILEKIGLDRKDDFINRAVQAYATLGGAFQGAAGRGVASAASNLSSAALSMTLPSELTASVCGASPGDVASQLNAEVERLVGPNSGVCASLAPGNPQLVEFYSAGRGKIASLELSECQSILKSLRPPISLAEVVEMLTLMSVG